MTIQITIIGLRQVGASIGLGLKDHPDLVKRVGHDRDAAIAKQAEKLGAVDQVTYNLPAAIRQADLVLLTEPVDQLLKTIDIIAPDLREGAVVMETTTVKRELIDLVVKKLPPERHFISLLPTVNPAYLDMAEQGVEGARADLFRQGLILIANPPGANAEAIKLAADLTNLLGATPMFIDAAEADGLAATVIQLPQLAAAALLNATTEQSGWREARKLTGPEYALATQAVDTLLESTPLGKSFLLNRDNAVRLIDYLVAALTDLRSAIDRQDEVALNERLDHARQARHQWLKQRQAANWASEDTHPPSAIAAGNMFTRLMGIRRPEKDRK